MPTASASASRPGISSLDSMMRQALATASARCSASAGSSGRQRLHALNPARSASAPVA